VVFEELYEPAHGSTVAIGNPHATGLDIRSPFALEIPAGTGVTLGLGVRVAWSSVPLQFAPRSGLGLTFHTTPFPGVIDVDYRGELVTSLHRRPACPWQTFVDPTNALAETTRRTHEILRLSPAQFVVQLIALSAVRRDEPLRFVVLRKPDKPDKPDPQSRPRPRPVEHLYKTFNPRGASGFGSTDLTIQAEGAQRKVWMDTDEH
jgi:hypothetical protein